MVSGKDPLRLRFAGNPELRVLPPRGAYDLPRSNTRRAFDLRCSEAPHFCVRVPGTIIASQEQSLRARLDENSLAPKKQSFNMETWSQGGLRYFVIGDASAADINSLAKLFRTAAS